MTVGGYAFTAQAERDLRAMLRHTLRSFGTHQHGRYIALIHRAATMLAESPERIGSLDCSALLVRLRAFPIHLAGSRRDASPHTLFYRAYPAGGVLILRILHAAMDPATHLTPSQS